eukprot:11740669-Karenia_brevis.AAC.1
MSTVSDEQHKKLVCGVRSNLQILAARCPVRFLHIKSHVGEDLNTVADELAAAGGRCSAICSTLVCQRNDVIDACLRHNVNQ